MSADQLRRAAEKLRKRADWFGTSSPWKVEYPSSGYPQRIVDDTGVLYGETYDGVRGMPWEAGTAEYVVLVHPPVALALADLLDDEAENVDDDGELYCVSGATLAVARAVLREDG